MKRISSLIILLPFCSLFSLEPGTGEKIKASKEKFIEQYGDRAIRKFEYINLDRTKNGVVDQWVRTRPGEPISSFDAVVTVENLLRLRLFKKVDITFSAVGEDQVDVQLQFDEKWSIYPVPIFYVFDGTTLGGIFVVESNLFGYNKGATLGGIISNRGWQYLVGYVDPNIAYSDFFGQIRSSGGSIFVENKTPDGKLFQDYQQLRADILYQAGYTFWDVLSPTITGGFFFVDIPVEDNLDKLNPPSPGDTYYQGVKLIYNDVKERKYYVLGLRSTVEYQHGFAFGNRGFAFDNWIGTNRYTAEAFWGTTVTLGLYWSVANLPPLIEHRLGGLEGSRVLPAFLVPADKYIASTFIYQIPWFEFDWGTITTIQFFEGGAFRRNGSGAQNFWGPGFGVRFYLLDITIPALGADIAYNIETRKYEFSVAVGFRPPR